MNKYDLTDRVAIVTGGAQGIGLGRDARMLASGAKVGIWDCDRTLLDRTVAELKAQGDVEGMVAILPIWWASRRP